MRAKGQAGNPVTILDPVHGFLRLSDAELAVVDTGVFQRLRLIRQLASAYLAYPGANHTRFEHSLGVMHVSGLSSSILEEKGYMNADEKRMVRLGALMHDVGHGPFSHVLDELIYEKGGESHEDTSQRVIKKSAIAEALSSHGFSPKEMSELAVGKSRSRKGFMNELIAGGLSADLMDYLLRDSYYTGAGFGRVTIERIIDSFEVHNERLALQKDALSTFESLAIARYEMFKSVYFHKTVRAAESMVLRAFQLCDEELRLSNTKDLNLFLGRTDESVIREILSLDSHSQEIRKSQQLVRDYLGRRLVKCVYEKVILRRERIAEKILSQQPIRDKLRQELADDTGIDPDHIFIDIPTTPSVPFTSERESFAGLELLTKKSGRIQVSRVSLADLPTVQAISGYMDILRVYTTSENREKLEKASRRILGVPDYSEKISV
ncbi:MAG: HD domain-containing protein [Nitrososphaerota archaeon]|jgi:HD superfamily phosphohydrolase|nr:HD domain-containing protein [Nitrososphaerota archaeon]